MGDKGGVKLLFCFDRRGSDELAERRLKPNRFAGFGGRDGGSSCQLPVPVLPVSCLPGAAGAPPVEKTRCSYFCRMYRSIAGSTSSASIGRSARTLRGLNRLLLSTLPVFFMLSTCSVVQLSILKLLTFETCVPNLRCSPAQRMHRNTPRFHDAHPGFFALQSAHRSLPGTLRRRSCNARSLRACWRFEMADAILVTLRSFGRGVSVSGEISRSTTALRNAFVRSHNPTNAVVKVPPAQVTFYTTTMQIRGKRNIIARVRRWRWRTRLEPRQGSRV